MPKSFRISAPYLTDEERREVATGYAGPAADTAALLGTWTPGGPRKIKVDPLLGGLQRHDLYGGTVDGTKVAERRSRNKAARRARRVNRKRGK